MKTILGKGLSQTTKEQAAEGMMNVLKKHAPHMALGGDDAIEALASTPEGVKALTEVGIKAFRGDMQALNRSFIDDLNVALPSRMGKVTERHLSEQLDVIMTETNKVMDNAGNKTITEAAQTKSDEAFAKVETILKDQFKSIASKTGKAPQGLYDVVAKYGKLKDELKGAVEVLTLLRESGQQKGFNPVALQKLIHDKMDENAQVISQGSPMLKDMITALYRGQPTGQLTERSIRVGLGDAPWLRSLPTWARALLPSYTVGKVYKGIPRDFQGTALTKGFEALTNRE
jgi:hypothetical protein